MSNCVWQPTAAGAEGRACRVASGPTCQGSSFVSLSIIKTEVDLIMITHYFTYFDRPFFDVLSFRKWIESIYTRDSMSSPWYNSTRFSLTRSMLFKSSCRHCPRNLCLRWAPYITNSTNHDASKWSTITFYAVSSDEHIGEMLHIFTFDEKIERFMLRLESSRAFN